VVRVGRLVRVAPDALNAWIIESTERKWAMGPENPCRKAPKGPKTGGFEVSCARKEPAEAENDSSRLDFRDVFPYDLGHGDYILGIFQRGSIWWIEYCFKGERLGERVSNSRMEAMEALEARRGDIVRGRFELVRKDRRQASSQVRYSHPSDERKMTAVVVLAGRGMEKPSLHVSGGRGSQFGHNSGSGR
jgi:hypothetical protein